MPKPQAKLLARVFQLQLQAKKLYYSEIILQYTEMPPLVSFQLQKE